MSDNKIMNKKEIYIKLIEDYCRLLRKPDKTFIEKMQFDNARILFFDYFLNYKGQSR